MSADCLRSVSPQSPLLAGELPPLAPSAYAPSPRKEGEEESIGGKTPDHTQPHSHVMRDEEDGGGGDLQEQKEVLQWVRSGGNSGGEVI